MNRRRFLAASALLGLLPASVRAQLDPLGDCPAIFVNGLLQFDPACALTIPGTSSEISPPSHLITPFPEGGTSTADITTPKERRRANAKERIDRQQAQQDQRLATKRSRHDRRQANKRDRRQRRKAGILRCNDFLTQAEAQDFFANSEYDNVTDPWNLDPNNNGIACEGLP